MKKKLEHIDSFDKSIYKEMGTTTVSECHIYIDDIIKVNDSNSNMNFDPIDNDAIISIINKMRFEDEKQLFFVDKLNTTQ